LQQILEKDTTVWNTRCASNKLIFGLVKRVTIELIMVEYQLLFCWSYWERVVCISYTWR
jgi:hypothetical protein